MPVADGFFAQDLFIDAASRGLAPAWRRLQLGDAEGARFFAEAAGAEAGAAAAQLRAAIAVQTNDIEGAVEALGAALPHTADRRELGPLAFQLGLCLQALGRTGEARAAFAQAAAACPGRAATWAAWARMERSAGCEDEARAVLDAALEHLPDDAELLNIRAAWCLKAKRYAEALDWLDRIDGAAATHPFILSNRGNAFLGLRRFDEADRCFATALEGGAAFFEGVFGRAMVAFDRGDDAQAESGLRAALELRPGHREALLRLSDVLARTRRLDDALAILVAILGEDDACYAAHYQAAILYYTMDLYDDAEIHARRALDLDPGAKALHDLIGLLLLHRGERAAASSSFRAASDFLGPEAAAFASNWAYTLHYDPTARRDEVFAAHTSFGARFGGAGEDPDWRFENAAEPERRLRVGYISPDFRTHSVAFFTAPLVAGHDRGRVEVFAYSTTTKRDPMTEWIAETVDGWRDVAALTAEETRARIRADGIDILVDLAGHTGDNPLAVFARRAAPVQVSYIGYPDTTGLPAMDYRIVDAVTDPEGEADAFASERLVRLPRPFLCYRPVPDSPPVTAGPMARGEPFTFGTFNTALKLNEPLFDAWAEILRAVPDSRILLKAKQYRTRSSRDWALEAFVRRGIAAERVEIMAFAPTLGSHLELYDRVDLALDTFPYNGTTTTCEALSMGVPVLSLRGDRHCARVGESLLGALGIDPVFLADDVADYVRRAVAWAGRRDELSELRPELRRRLLASELCDEPGLVRAVEDAYRAMWRKWCADGPRTGLGPSRFDREYADACARR